VPPTPRGRRRAHLVTDGDVALLRAVVRRRSLVGASREVGVSRDRAVYRIARLARAFGGPVVRATRGGTSHGGTELTALGDRIVRGGFDSVELLDTRPRLPSTPRNVLRGVYRADPEPEVRVGRTLRLRVAFAARDGETVGLVLDPEAVVVARRRFPSSARNVLEGRLLGLRRDRAGSAVTLSVRSGGVPIRVAVTEATVRLLRLRPGTRVVLYLKATALRPVAAPSAGTTRGSLRS